MLNPINFASIINNIHVAKVHGQRQSNTSQMNQKVIMGQWLDSISLAVFKSESCASNVRLHIDKPNIAVNIHLYDG